MRYLFVFLLASLLLVACHPQSSTKSPKTPELPPRHAAPTLVQRIAFGSCAEQNKPQPILNRVVQEQPDLFIYLGDNIYGDTPDMGKLARQYQQLGRKSEFQNLWKTCQVLATWDDHDYGANDAGRYFAPKAISRNIFLDFWQEPKDSPRRQHDGVYHSEYYGPADKRVQVILLDTRYFRDNLLKNDDNRQWKNHYRPNDSPDSTFLGAAQWAWLENELKQPAVFRIMASSNQFCHEYNGWESWTNVPQEQNRMLDLIRSTQAEGLVFISGDVHWGELSMQQWQGLYPIYDLTSSGITERWPRIEPNGYRIGPPEAENNYGLFTIDWQADPILKMELKTVSGATTTSVRVKRSELGFK